MRILRNLGLAAVGVLSGLLLAEGLTRLYMAVVPAPADSVYVSDRDAGYRLRPDPPEVYERDPDNYINSFGFRDREHAVAKPPGTYRILGIGDSFVYGDVKSLEDHFLQVARKRAAGMAAAESLEVEMISMGVGGYSPEHEVGVLCSIGLTLHPDLVILNFYVGNDVTAIPIRGKVLRGRLYFLGSPYPLLALLRHSYFFVLTEKTLLPRLRGTLLRWYMEKLAKREGGEKTEPSAETAVPAGTSLERPALTGWYLHAQRKDLPVYLKEPDARTQGLWGEAEGYLREFDRLCDEAGVPWILNLIPTEVQVDAELRETVLRELALPADRYDFDAPQRRLRRFAASLGAPVVDPLEEMRARLEPGLGLYRPNDIHWNLRGHRIAGEALGDRIAGGFRSAGP